jgi:ribosome maturation factor RimP
MKLDAALQKQLSALVESEGLELVATEVVGNGPKTILRLVIDGESGVSLDKCALISKQASPILDVEDPFHHHYTLEVTSPGLDRKLYSPSDFRRYAAQRIRVRMKPSYRQHRTVSGELQGLDHGKVGLRLDTGEEIKLPYDEVHEARIEVDWKKIMSEGKSRR